PPREAGKGIGGTCCPPAKGGPGSSPNAPSPTAPRPPAKAPSAGTSPASKPPPQRAGAGPATARSVLDALAPCCAGYAGRRSQPGAAELREPAAEPGVGPHGQGEAADERHPHSGVQQLCRYCPGARRPPHRG